MSARHSQIKAPRLIRRDRSGPIDAEMKPNAEQHVGLVHMWARRMAPVGDREDYVQDGMVGLLRALDAFDPEKGFKFSTYASYWIRQAMQRGAQTRSNWFGIGGDVDIERRAIQTVVDDYVAEQQRRPATEQIAARTGFSSHRIEALSRTATVSYLDDPSNARSHPESVTGSASDGFDDVEWRLSLGAALRRLVPEEAALVRSRYGLDGHEAVSVESFARAADVSVRRSRERLATAKRAIARHLEHEQR